MPFITNSLQKTLEYRLREIITRAEEINILVGFFYFSATPFLYEILKNMYEEGKLRDGYIKILVGLDTDQHINSLYEYALETKGFQKDSLIEENFLKSIEKAFTSNQTDKDEFYKQIDFFIKLLQEGKLIIKKTRKPNHSKLYLFKLNDTITPSLFITGSSNLTKAGINHQDEFNVEIKDYGFNEAKDYFDKLWNEAVELNREKIIQHIYTKTFFKQITPFEAYVYALKTYIETYTDISETSKKSVEAILQEASYKPYTYQVEAINQAVRIIQTHNGVILADVVGLGKSVIATAIAKRLGMRGVVIAPPHLIGDDSGEYGWKKYLADFKLHDWRVFSVGKLEEAVNYVSKHDDIKIVIVDEAHRFRNENTKNYFLLQKICIGRNTILLTATPFNNRPADIFAMLKLFTIPKKSTIVFDEDIKSKFDEFERLFKKLSYIKIYHNSKSKKNKKLAQSYYKEIFKENIIDLNSVNEKSRQLAKQIKGIIEPVVIRRNRLDLKYYPEKIDLPQIKDPKETFFELTKEQSEFYDEVIQSFDDITEGGKFTGAIYFPERYKKEEDTEKEDFIYLSQKNLYSFMRRLLVKRFESSFGAFNQSIQRFLKIHQSALEFIERTGKFILNRDIIEKILEIEEDDEINQKLLEFEESLKSQNINSKYYEVYKLEDLKRPEDFKKDIQKDINLFEEILKKFSYLNLEHQDPKAEKLKEEIKHYLKDRKVIIFTEYTDTAEHLRNILEKEFEGQILTAYGNLTKNTLKATYENFDANGLCKDEYKILLTTDKLSEGFNLNRAGVVINYDIPWNPVRVIQRVGRINRIGKKIYDELYIVNFFPTEKGADIVRSREIAQNKMFMIHKVLGEDAKIFSPDEEPQASTLYKKLNTFIETEEENFISKIRKEFEQIKEKHPNIIKQLNNLPPRIKVAKKHWQNNLIVIIKKSQDLFVAYKEPNNQQKILSFEEIYNHIKSDPEDKPLKLSDNFWQDYQQILNYNYPKEIKSSAKDRETTAKNILKTILSKPEIPQQLKDFIDSLIYDIDNLGTLSEYMLSKIGRWDISNTQKVINQIYELKQKYKEPNIDFQKLNLDTVYILAIENREV